MQDMWRQSRLGLMPALLVAVALSCSGGQTGQPDSGECSPLVLGRTARWLEGSTVGELAQAFNGSHRAAVHWLEEPIGSPHATPVTFDDNVTIVIEYRGGSATSSSCGGDLQIPVAVEIATTESALSDHGVGSLRFSGTMAPLLAQLTFAGAVVSVSAALSETALAEAPRGTLEPHAAGAPGGSATYP